MDDKKSAHMLRVPFYANTTGDGSQCFQVAMQSVLKYFLGRDFGLEELDRLTKRKAGKWTATPQIVPPLYDLGLNVEYFSKMDIKAELRGEAYLRESFGADFDKISQFVDIDSFVDSLRNLTKYDLFRNRILRQDELVAHVDAGHVPLVLLDWSVVLGRSGAYQGHFGVMTGFDSDNVYFHHSGPEDPEPNMRIPKDVFARARNANGTDNDVVIVHGKR